MPKQVIKSKRMRRNNRRVIRKQPLNRYDLYTTAGSQLWRDVQLLKSFVNTEFKYFDDSTLFTNIPYITAAGVGTPLLMSLNDVPRGDAGNQRTGMSVRFRSLQHSCTIDNTATSSLPCRVRMIFFLQLRPDGVAPVLGNLLDLTSDPDPINAFRNLNYKSQFAILKDKVFKLDTSAPQHQQEMKWYKQVNFHTNWTVGNTDGTNITKNAVYCFVFCDQAGAVLPCIRCMTRTRFIDN